MQSWKTEADRRAFFDKYAASKGMDPRNPDFWSRVAVGDLRHHFQPVYCTSPPKTSPLAVLPLSLPFLILSSRISVMLFISLFWFFVAGIHNNSWILRGTVIDMSHATLSWHRPEAVSFWYRFVPSSASASFFYLLKVMNHNLIHK